MSNHSLSSQQSELERELETLSELREHIAQLSRLYRKRQQKLLQNSETSRIGRAAVIVGVIQGGARVRWGLRGWEIEDSGISIPSDVISALSSSGLIEGHEGLAVWKGSRHPEPAAAAPIVEYLLCDRWANDLDRFSRVMLRYEQKRALLLRISEIRGLYEDLRQNRASRDYIASLRETFRWKRALIALYACALLQLWNIGPQYRVGLARRSLSAMENIIHRPLDHF